MFKRLLLVSIIFLTSTFVSLQPSNANPACLYDSVRVTKANKSETYAVWLARQRTQLNNPACFTNQKGLQSVYNKLKPTAEAIIAQSQKSEFDRRFEACNQNNGSSLNPRTWANITKCSFTVSFFPTANPLKQKFNQTINTMKTNQPISYIPVANKMVQNVRNNWGGTECKSGDIDFTVRMAGISNPFEFIIPCKPATPLQVLRQFMVVSVWLGFVFWLYRQGSNFLKERKA